MDALRCPPGDAGDEPLGRRAAPRRAVPAACCRSPTCCCSTSRPTISTPSRSRGCSASSRTIPGTVVTVTHDRYFLDEVAGWILELDRGHGIPYEGNYSGWLEQKQPRLAQEGRQEEARQRTLERELEWVRQSPRARQAKSKARLQAYEELVAQSREKAPDNAQIVLPPGPRLGDLVIEARASARRSATACCSSP